MYKRHKKISIIVILFLLVISFSFSLEYNQLAKEALTVVSISIAVYISVATSLLGSPYSKAIKQQQDKEHPEKSMLGTLTSYLSAAGLSSILTLIISCLYIVFPSDFLGNIPMNQQYYICRVFSSVSIACFGYNLTLMFLILKFMITAVHNASIIKDI